MITIMIFADGDRIRCPKSLKIRDVMVPRVPRSWVLIAMGLWLSGWVGWTREFHGIPVSWLDDGLLQGFKKARVSWCLLL
jgi:hypothetical protein